MNCFLKVLKLASLCVFIVSASGCATSRDTSDVLPSDATPSTSDSHGWGENVEAGGH